METFEVFWRADDRYCLPGEDNYLDKNHIFTFGYIHRKDLALGARFGRVLGLQGRLLWLPGVAILAEFIIFFEILDKAGDINNSTSKPNYCDESYCDLGLYVHKVPSAWGKVWYSAFKGRLLWLPGVAILAEF